MTRCWDAESAINHEKHERRRVQYSMIWLLDCRHIHRGRPPIGRVNRNSEPNPMRAAERMGYEIPEYRDRHLERSIGVRELRASSTELVGDSWLSR